MQVITKTTQHASADVFAAIAHPLRRQILDLLCSEERSVQRLSESFQVSRPAISQHLRVLLEAGLVSEQREGRENRYRVEAANLYEVQTWVSQYEQFWTNKLDALGTYLGESANLPKNT